MGKKGELSHHSSLEGEGRKCPSENRAAAQSPGEGSSPVYLPSLPGGKSLSDRVTPAALCCSVSVPAGAGHALALAQTPSLPRVPPAAPTTPAHSRLGLPLPLPWWLRRPQLPFSGRAVSGGTGSYWMTAVAMLRASSRLCCSSSWRREGRERMSAEPPKGSSGWLPAGQRDEGVGDTV